MKGTFALLLVLVLAPALWAQGRLEQVRQEVNAPSPPSRDEGRRSQDEDPDELFGPLVYGVVLAPFVLPRLCLSDSSEVDGYFPSFPYAGGHPGYPYLHREGPLFTDEARALFGDRGPREWSARLSVEDGNDFQGLNRLNGIFVVDTTFRLGLRTSWNYLRETFSCGCHDDLLLGDFNLTYRFAQHERVQMFAGVGARVLTEAGERRSTSAWGVNFLYGADIFPVRPVVISPFLEFGTLGSASFFHARCTAGYCFGRWEAFAGYDFLRIGSVNLQGPLAGVRLWF